MYADNLFCTDSRQESANISVNVCVCVCLTDFWGDHTVITVASTEQCPGSLTTILGNALMTEHAYVPIKVMQPGRRLDLMLVF